MSKLLKVLLVVVGESQYHHHRLVGGAVNNHDSTHPDTVNRITIIIFCVTSYIQYCTCYNNNR